MDWEAARLAGEQFGVVSYAQLAAIGFTSDNIAKRCKQGRLHAIGPTVYSVGHLGISRKGRATAALLQVGEDAGLSHITAARFWEMVRRGTGGEIHVSVMNRSRRVPVDGVNIHRPRTLRAHDVIESRGFRVTSPERTLIDLLPKASIAEITRMLEQMVTVLGRSPDDLHTWGHGLRHVEGRKKLLRALDEVAGPVVIRSEFESRFRTLCQNHGLPMPEANHRLGRWEVDGVWRDLGVAVELDSWRWHGGRWQFHVDRKKGLAINRAGFELVRLTWPQVKYEQREVAETLRLTLNRHGAELG